MASQQAAPATSPTAQEVGNAFVHRYYNILHQSPDLVYRFYQDSSKLGRPDADGAMSSTTTMQAINEKILSLDYSEIRVEIKTVDAQDSLNGGVVVLVTGHLISMDKVKRNFTQSFFLAPQDKGYYVLNDIFRYVDEVGQVAAVGNVNEAAHIVPLTPERESTAVQENHIADQDAYLSEEDHVGDEVYNPNDNGEGFVVQEEVAGHEAVDESNAEPQAPNNLSSLALEEAPKKSYASIVKVMKDVAPPSAPTSSPARPAAATPERQVVPAPLPVPVPDVSAPSSNAAESSTIQEPEASDGHSIYIRGLPMNATPSQVEEEFKRFGPIKSGGVQVRSNTQQGFCFGFVEFEASSSVQSAIEASPITIGGRQAYVEEKRPSSSRVSRGRFQSGRGGFRNDGARVGRGNYGSGRGYGRGNFNYRPEFANRSSRGGSSYRGGEGGYQRVEHAGNGGGGANWAGESNTNASAKDAVQQEGQGLPEKSN